MMAISRRTHLSVPLPVVAIFVVLFLPRLHSAPTSPTGALNKCDIVTPCRPGQASALGYNSGLYKYDFESEIETAVTSGRDPESRKTKVKAEVILTSYTPCDFVLKVNSLAVSTDRNGELVPVEGVKDNLVRFTLHDGIIGSVCTSEDEPTWTGNVKRAIISLLQNKALNGISDNQIIESDISGRCPTKYSIDGNTYTKIKKLQACSHRDGGAPTYFGVPYDVNSERNSVPNAKSSQSCEQTLENNIIKSVQCTETHVVKRILRPDAGPNLETTVKTSLTLVSSRPGAPKIAPPRNLVQSSIYFDHSSNTNDALTQSDSAAAIRDIVDRITNNIRPDGVTSDVPVLFLTLKNAFDAATPEAVEAIYTEISSSSLPDSQKEKLKKLYVDAAADSASDSAIVLLAKLVKAGAVDRTTKYKFYLHSTFAGRPNEPALRAVLPLLEGTGTDVGKKALLSVSGLAHQYCKITNKNCGQNEAYKAIVDRIAAVVNENIGNHDSEVQEVVVAALQALGNLDSLTPAATGAISAALDVNCNRLKARALDAFRRDPCQAELKAKAQQMFADVETPANLRIGAYLANVRCLEAGDARVIQRVLDQEDSIQVGGYIQSHLYNMAKSSSPSTRQLQNAARQLQLNLKFPLELRRFSRHLHMSMFNSDANLGLSAEGNVIFSKDSFIPKQISGNLTLDVFGNSYNLIEVGAYLDNLDGLQESLFGPNGKYPFSGEIDSRAIINRILKRRPQRSVGPVQFNEQGLQAISSQVATTDRSSEASTVDLYVRVFGTTIRTVSVDPKKTEESLEKIKEKLGSLLGAPTRELDATNPILFLNDQIAVPTGSGLALNTIAEAATIPTVDYSRKYQQKTENQPLDIQIKLVTNSATSLRLRQSVVGGPFELGLQLEGTVRTGGGAELTVKSDGSVSEAKINFPFDKLRTFELSTNVFWVQKSAGKPEVKAPFRNQLDVQPGPESCERTPLNAALGAIGLRACFITNVDISQDNAEPVLLRGKQYLSLNLEKTEAGMQGYSAVFSRKKNGGNREYKLELDTPGSSTNRKVSIVALSNTQDVADGMTRKTDVTITTPYKAGNIKIEVERTEHSAQKGLSARVTSSKGSVALTAQVGIQRSGDTVTYTPLLRLEHPNRSGKQETDDFIKGSITRTPGKKLSVNLRTSAFTHVLENYENEAYLRGTVEGERSGQDYKYRVTDLAVGLQDPGREGQDYLNINGVAQRDGSKATNELTVKYGMNLEYTTKYNREYVREDGKIKLVVKVESDQAWFLNLDSSTNVEWNKEAGTYSSSRELVYGPHDKPRLTLSQKTDARVTSKSDFDVQNKLKFYFPVRNTAEETYDLSLSSHVKCVPEEQLIAIEFLSGENGSRAKASINFDRKAANNNDFALKLALTTERRSGELGVNRATLNDDESKKFTSSYKYDINLKSSTLKLNEVAITTVRISNKPEKRGLILNSVISSSSDRSPLNGITVDLQMKKTPERSGLGFGIKRQAEEFISLDAKVQKGATPADAQVSVKAFVINTLRLQLTRTIPSEGQVETKAKAELLRSGRTVTLDVKRQKDGDMRKLNADLKWDADKDQSQSIQLNSATKITKGSIIIDSKNDITVIGKNVKINLAAKIPDNVRDGEHSVSLDVVGADGKNYKIDYVNVLSITPALRTSSAKLSLNVPDAPPTDIQLELKSQDPNRREGVFDITADLRVVQNGAISHSMLAQLASQKPGDQQRSVSAKLEFGGQRFPEEIKLESTLTHGYDSAGLKASWQFGSAESEIEINGERSVADNTKSRQVTFNLKNIPGLKYQIIEGRIAGKVDQLQDFNIQKELEIKADGKNLLSYKILRKHQNGQLRAVAQLNYKNKQLLNANLKGSAVRELVDVSGKISGEYFNISVLTKIQPVAFPIGEVKFEIESAAPAVASLSLKAQNTGPGKYTGGVTATYDGKTASVTGEVVNNDGERGLSLAVSGPNVGDVSGELILRGLDREQQEVSTKLTLNGKTVAAAGNYKKSAGGYDGTLEVEVPKSSGKAVYGLKFNIQDGRRSLEVTENGADGKVDHLSLDYTIQSLPNGRITEGTFSTDVLSHFYDDSPPQVSGSFKSEYYKIENADGEKGREAKLDLKLTSSDPARLTEIAQELPLLFGKEMTAEVKVTNAEFRVKLTSSNPGILIEPAQDVSMLNTRVITTPIRRFRRNVEVDGPVAGSTPCSIDIQVKIPRPGSSPKIYTSKFVVVQTVDDAVLTEGFVSTTQCSRSPYSLDHSTKIYFGNEATDVISLDVKGQQQGEDSCTGSADLNLPGRQISLEMARQGGKSLDVSAWLDKTREPENKLNIAGSFERLGTEDGAEGYQYNVKITHPTLPKALVVKRKVVRFGRLTLHDSETELDIFQDSANKILITGKANFVNEDRRELTLELSMKSDGLGIEVAAAGNVQLDTREAHLDYTFKRPNGEVKTRKVHIVASKNVQSISVGDSSNPEILISRTVRNLGDHRRRRSINLNGGRDVRYEIKLPGMTDTRVIDVHLHTSSPPHLNIKTFATGAGKSYEVSLGYPTERQYLVGFYLHEGTNTKSLAQLSVVLNRTQLVVVKANWDKQGLEQFVQTAKQRLQGTEDRLEDSLDNYVDQLTSDVQEVLRKLSSALPDCAPFRSHVSSELAEIRQEIEQNPAFNRARSNIRAMAEATKELCEFIEEVTNTLASLPEYLKNLSKNSPGIVKRYEKVLRRLRNTMGAVIANTLRTVRPIIIQLADLVKQLTDKMQGVQARLQSRAENAVSKVRAASDNALAKLIELLLSRADDLSGQIESANMRPEVKEVASAVLNFAVARLRGENPDPEVLANQIKASMKKLLGEFLTVDLENGEIAFPVPLPRPINSLLEVRTAILNALPSSKTVVAYRNRLVKPLDIARQSLRDLIQTNFLTAASRALRTNIPPHPARAYIIGSQYLITFDGKLVHLEGKCQYLLLADFPKNEFRVAIQYHNVDGAIKKTIVASDGDETATVNPDNVVEAHGTAGPHIDLIEKDDAIGFRMLEHNLNVVCSRSQDVCTIDLLNGYMFGKIGGLLGNYNNEQYDDLRTPAGQRTSNEEEFTNSWKLDSQCTEDAVPAHPPVSSAARDACSSAFSSWRSPLRSCFKYSNPEEFEGICNRLSTENGWSVEQAVCTSLSAYEQTCQGISLYSYPFTTSAVLSKPGCGIF